MTTLAELRTIVRRSLGDFPRVVIDTIPSYDGSTNPINTGKDLPIETASETITVNGITQVRGVDYTIDYDARQTTWLVVPAAGDSLRLRYKECRYKTEQVDEGLNQGRRILFPTIYKKDVASITTSNLVRDYDLRLVANEGWARAVFGEGHLSFKVLRAFYKPFGVVAQTTVPFRNYWQQGESAVHLWELLPVGYTLNFEIAYAFTPLANASDVTDIPELAQSLVTEWATSILALKKEPQRGTIDTYNVTQGPFANPPGTMAQTSDDFARRVREIRGMLNVEPLVITPPNIPFRWEVGAR